MFTWLNCFRAYDNVQHHGIKHVAEQSCSLPRSQKAEEEHIPDVTPQW